MAEMTAIADRLDAIAPKSRARLDRAMAGAGHGSDVPFAELVAKRDHLLALA